MAASGKLGALYLYSRPDTCSVSLAISDYFIERLNSLDQVGGRAVRAFNYDPLGGHGLSPSGKMKIERFLMTVIRPTCVN